MTAGAIPGTVALLERLAADGVPLYAITNFPAETFPLARKKFNFLGLFRDVAVSGVERVVKPNAEIFHILLRRNGLAAAEAVFIDDSIKNVEAARTLGLHAIHFRAPGQLEQELRALGMLHA
jgi:2-haloacid dehalogenase